MPSNIIIPRLPYADYALNSQRHEVSGIAEPSSRLAQRAGSPLPNTNKSATDTKIKQRVLFMLGLLGTATIAGVFGAHLIGGAASLYYCLPMLGISLSSVWYIMRNSAWKREGVNKYEWLTLGAIMFGTLALGIGPLIANAQNYTAFINPAITTATSSISLGSILLAKSIRKKLDEKQAQALVKNPARTTQPESDASRQETANAAQLEPDAAERTNQPESDASRQETAVRTRCCRED